MFKAPSFGEGREVCVEFIKFIRHEEKFSSLDALKTQIAKDHFGCVIASLYNRPL